MDGFKFLENKYMCIHVYQIHERVSRPPIQVALYYKTHIRPSDSAIIRVLF